MNMNMYGCYGNSIWYDWICMTHGSTIEMSYLHGILSLRSPWPYPRNVHGFGYCILPLHVGHSCAWNMSVHTYIIYATIYMNHVYMQDLWGPARWHITNAVIFDVYMSAIVCHLRLFLPWQNHRYGFKLFASTKCIRMSHPLILVIPSPCVPDLRCRVCVIATTPWIYIYIYDYIWHNTFTQTHAQKPLNVRKMSRGWFHVAEISLLCWRLTITPYDFLHSLHTHALGKPGKMWLYSYGSNYFL